MIGSTAPKGSSMSMIGGSAAIARATPTRLLLAARELRRVTVAVVVRGEADELEELVHALSYALPLSQPSRCGTVAMFVGDGAVGEEAYLLDGVADLAPQLGAAHGGVRLAVYEDLAVRELDQPVHHPHGRGLAAPRRTHQNTNLSFWNLEGEIG